MWTSCCWRNNSFRGFGRYKYATERIGKDIDFFFCGFLVYFGNIIDVHIRVIRAVYTLIAVVSTLSDAAGQLVGAFGFWSTDPFCDEPEC